MIRKFTTLALVAGLAACGTAPKYVPLAASAKSSMTSIEVRNAFPQDEVFVVAKNPGVSAALGGGLLGALIDSQVADSRQKDLQSVIEPFYAAVDDVDYRTEFWAAMEPRVKQSFSGQIGSMKANPAMLDLGDVKKAKESLQSGQGLLFLHTRYEFTDDYKYLVTKTAVNLWSGTSKDPIFSNIYSYESKPSSGAGISAWSDKQGKAYREAVQEGAREIAHMLTLDLTYQRIEGKDTGLAQPAETLTLEGHQVFSPVGSGKPVQVSGPVLDKQAERVVIRDAEGRLWSLANKQ